MPAGESGQRSRSSYLSWLSEYSSGRLFFTSQVRAGSQDQLAIRQRRSEVPVLVLGDDGLSDHIARTGAGEEVVVLNSYLFRGLAMVPRAKTRHCSSR